MTSFLDFCVLDLWPGVSAGFRWSVARAARPHCPASYTADHHAALLPRKPSIPPHQPQPGGRGKKRFVKTSLAYQRHMMTSSSTLAWVLWRVWSGAFRSVCTQMRKAAGHHMAVIWEFGLPWRREVQLCLQLRFETEALSQTNATFWQ